MFRLKLTSAMLVALMAMLSASVAVQAADDVKKPSKAKASKKKSSKNRSLIRGYYAIIDKEIKFTDAQRAKLESALKDRLEARNAWEEENGKKDKELSAAIKAAKKAKDADKAKSLAAEQKKLRAERDNGDVYFKSKFNALLSPSQQTHLAGYSLYIGTMQRLSKAKLSDEQKAKVKAMAIEAGEDIPTGDDKKVDREFRAAFAEKAKQAVLSAEQIKALEKKK